MDRLRSTESGQTMIEFAIICLVLLMMTMGLIDVGRAFFQYNALADAARFGARWGSVVGGACNLPGGNTTDWCTQEGVIKGTPKVAVANFWQQAGNTPLQGNGTECPKYSSAPSDYYSASDPDNDSDNDYTGDADGDPASKSTTIVGAIGQHFDTSSTTSHTVGGGLAGIDLTQLEVCIQTSNPSGTLPQTGADYVTVVLHYHFDPVSFIVAKSGFDLEASSTYEVEGTPYP